MSFKKLIISFFLGAFLCFMSAAYAGGTVPGSNPPVAEPVDYSGVYVDHGIGYAKVNWSTSTLGVFNNFNSAVIGITTSNGDGGFSFGGDVGYQINRYLGFEFGWFHLPKVKGNSDIAVTLPPLILKSWVAYAALKAMAPIWGKLDIFAKVGGSYRYLRFSDTASITTGFGGQNDQFWAVMFALGLQYWLDQNWVFAVQYLHFAESAHRSNVNLQAPAAHLMMATLGYKFGL